MNTDQLNAAFAIPGSLTFKTNEHSLISAVVTTPACRARLYLQGAHLSEWQPTGHEPVLFLSEKSAFQSGKAIRGGVTIIFPWFGPRTANAASPRTDGPSHGFARTTSWQFSSATTDGDNLVLTLLLEPDETSRALGFDNFRVTYRVSLGADLEMSFTVENNADDSLYFEEALHSYFYVGDAIQLSIDGLAKTEYFDKPDSFKRKRQVEEHLMMSGETDRPYINTQSTVTINDPVLKRKIIVEKSNSKTTVVWNPWAQLTSKLADMEPDGWKRMVCIETANATAENIVVLPPREKHTMTAHIRAVKNQHQT